MGKIGDAKQGLATTDNKLYLRLWHEICYHRISFDTKSCEETKRNKVKWYPYSKGGTFRKWSSINEYVVNYENNGEAIKKSVLTKYTYLKTPDFVVKNTDTYFSEGLTWNDVSTGTFCSRYVPRGFIYDAAGPMFFCTKKEYVLGYMNSVVFQTFASLICQGLHYSTGHIPQIPFLPLFEHEDRVNELVDENLKESTCDWDSFETSWNFKKHPLI